MFTSVCVNMEICEYIRIYKTICTVQGAFHPYHRLIHILNVWYILGYTLDNSQQVFVVSIFYGPSYFYNPAPNYPSCMYHVTYSMLDVHSTS